jgi:phosphoribosylanthranilate isomerase
MSVVVKICGITRLDDARVAVEAGADALGFVFWEKSPRHIEISQAAAIIRELPPMIVKVGVFVDPDEALVLRAISEAGVNLLQFHGSEPAEFCTQFGLMSMKAFRVKDEHSLDGMEEYGTQAYLLDAYSPGAPGGTGERFNWDLAVRARRLGKPVFLAGGLTPANVAEAVRAVNPYGVDVSSGVEAAPGRKDHSKITAFISAAKSACPPDPAA